jgi:hypothetical protein
MQRSTIISFVTGALAMGASLQLVRPGVVRVEQTELRLLSFEGRVLDMPDGGSAVEARACGHEFRLSDAGAALVAEPCWRVTLPSDQFSVQAVTEAGAKR